MIPIPYVLLAVIGALCLGTVGGYYQGVSMERGQAALAREKAVKSATEQLRQDLQAQTQVAVAAAENRAKKRLTAREAKHDFDKLPPRPECNWSADEQRVRNALYDAYFPEAPARRVQGEVRAATPSGESPFALGGSDAGLGVRLPQSAR